MQLNEYQQLAAETVGYPKPIRGLPIYPALALGGEAGEFQEKIKKAWRDATELDVPAAIKELGDLLWYISAAARDLGYTLEQVAQMNLDKLVDRARRGTLAGAGDDR